MESSQDYDDNMPLSIRLEDAQNEAELKQVLKDRSKSLKLVESIETDLRKKYQDDASALLSQGYYDHKSPEIRLLVACCLADILRLLAPDPPFYSEEQTKLLTNIFLNQLEHLKTPSSDPTQSSFQIYLLVSLTKSKVLNWLSDAEPSADIDLKAIQSLLEASRNLHEERHRGTLVGMICSIIEDIDTIPLTILDCVLQYMVSPKKRNEKAANEVVSGVLRRSSTSMETSLKRFINSFLVENRLRGSTLIPKIYELIYEVTRVLPSLMTHVLPHLESKLESENEDERMEVTKLSARLLADPDMDVASEYKSFWKSFLGRFNDAKWKIRMKCVQYAMHLMKDKPDLSEEIGTALTKRQHDINEVVRFEVIVVIADLAKLNFDLLPDSFLDIVKERTLDTNFKIRRESLLALGQIYRDHRSSSRHSKRIEGIRDKILHAYYRPQLEDRLIVERILYTCLVPLSTPGKERAKHLLELFNQCDEHSVRALQQVFRCQSMNKTLLNKLLLRADEEPDLSKFRQSIESISKNLVPEDENSGDIIFQFLQLVKQSPTLHSHMSIVLGPPRDDVENNVREILKLLCIPFPKNHAFMKIKQLLERVAPSMITAEGLSSLIDLVVAANVTRKKPGKNLQLRPFELLLLLSEVIPECFNVSDCIERICGILEKTTAPPIRVLILKALWKIGLNLENRLPDIATRLKLSVTDLIVNGNNEEAKFSVKCLDRISMLPSADFGSILITLKDQLKVDNERCEASLIALSWISLLRPETFEIFREEIIIEIAVKEILMKDNYKEQTQDSKKWCEKEDLVRETRLKISAIKLMTRWLLGVSRAYLKNQNKEDNTQERALFRDYLLWGAQCSMRLLITMIQNHGDLMKTGQANTIDRAHLRLVAAKSIIDICSHKPYPTILTTDQFRMLSPIVTDEFEEVRERFCAKLYKRLRSSRLPIYYMSLFVFVGSDPKESLQQQVRNYIIESIRVARQNADRFKKTKRKRQADDRTERNEDGTPEKLDKTKDEANKRTPGREQPLDEEGRLENGEEGGTARGTSRENEKQLMGGGEEEDFIMEQEGIPMEDIEGILAEKVVAKRSEGRFLRNLPENAVVYSIYLLARNERFVSVKDPESLRFVMDCLWFILVHFCEDTTRNDVKTPITNPCYSFSYYKKLAESIKRARDRMSPKNAENHTKLFAVCDMLLGLLMSRHLEYGRKESFSVVLPSKLFWIPGKIHPYNNKYYLPPDFTFHVQHKKRGTRKRAREESDGDITCDEDESIEEIEEVVAETPRIVERDTQNESISKRRSLRSSNVQSVS